MEATEAQTAMLMRAVATIVGSGVSHDIYADESTTAAARAASQFLAQFAGHIASGKGESEPFAFAAEVR